MKQPIRIDSMVGGLGDIWMRLSALYSLAALVPECEIQLRIPKALVGIAHLVWPDRFLVTPELLRGSIEITHLGLRHLSHRLIMGRRFLSPFYQILRADRKVASLKHLVNDVLIRAVTVGGTLRIPTASSVDLYQGYHEFSAVREFSAIPYVSFLQQAAEDFAKTRIRLQVAWPRHDEPKWQLVVLPSGTGHQIMPPDWALANLPGAIYVFFAGDSFKAQFRDRGLQVMDFYGVEDLFKISSQAQFAVVTDSFPSHALQAYSASTVVALSQQPRSRIVHPAFDGQVIQSVTQCCPCANRARGIGKCDAGFDVCATWSDRGYTRNLLAAIS